MAAAHHPAFGEVISSRLAELAALSDEPGRLTRLYLSPAHRRAIDLVSYWMRDAGMSVRLDPLASVVGRYEAQDGGTPTLLLGSHIDSVRNAGRFDGPLGVVTAIEVVEGGVPGRQALSVRDRSRGVRRRGRRALRHHARRLAGAGRQL